MRNILLALFVLCLGATILMAVYRMPRNRNAAIPSAPLEKATLAGTRLNGVALGDSRQDITRNLGREWNSHTPLRGCNIWTCRQRDASVEVWFDREKAVFIQCFCGTWILQHNGQILIKSGERVRDDPLPSIGDFILVPSSGGFCYRDASAKAVIQLSSFDGRLDSAILQYERKPSYLYSKRPLY